MPSPVFTVTLQAALFSIVSTLFAQSITMYQSRQLSWIDTTSVLRFMAIAIIMTPPNYFYQKFLEESYPARPEGKSEAEEKGKGGGASIGKLSISNTIQKFVLDQSIGAGANTLLFIVLLDVLKGYGGEAIMGDVRRDLWPMMKSGWSFWPVVSLSNLLVVPFEYRMLVGNISGLLWGTYVNLQML